MQGADGIVNVIKLYNGSTWFLPLFLLAMAYLIWRMDKGNRRNMILTVIAALILVFNPLAFWAVSKVVGGETYYRFLWMLPVMPILGYVIVDLFVRQKTRIGKALVLLAAGVILVFSGNSCVTRESLKRPENVTYLNQEAQQVCNIIQEDKSAEFVRVAAPYEIMMSLRLYDSSIIHFIKRSTYQAEGEIQRSSGSKIRQYRAYKLVNGKKISAKKVRKVLERGKIAYMVIATHYGMDNLMKKSGCTVAGRTANYTVYRS